MLILGLSAAQKGSESIAFDDNCDHLINALS
jgi:hypothetical protein